MYLTLNSKKISLSLKLIAVFLIFFVFFGLGIKNASAVQCPVVVSHSCNADGLQECTMSTISCDYGCELTQIFPGNVCVNNNGSGNYDCSDWHCSSAPVSGCIDPFATNYNPSATISDGSCVYTGSPTPPTITGPTTGFKNVTKTFSAQSTDPGGFQIRYGADWSSPSDNVVDSWSPVFGYTNSGTVQNLSNSWSTIGVKSFQIRAQNQWGKNSDFITRYITIYDENTTLVASPSNVNTGDNVNVTFSNVVGPESLDWIGMYPLSENNDGNFLGWVYSSSCTQTASTGRATGTCTFTMPTTPGEYNFRIFYGGTWERLVTSNTVIVSESENGSDYSVTVNVNQGIGGSIKSSDNIINTTVCGSPCVKNYASGTPITLIGVPASSYWKFTGWSGSPCSGTGLCMFSIGSDVSIDASFSTRRFIYIEQ